MNVKFHCDECNSTVFAPPGSTNSCQKNLREACKMVQVEEFPVATPKPAKQAAKTTRPQIRKG